MAAQNEKNLSVTNQDDAMLNTSFVNINDKMDDEDEIDLYALLMVLLDHIWVVVGCTILFGVIFGAISYFCIAPTYESTTKLYIVSASGDSVVDLTDLNIGTSLTADYEELLTSYPVVSSVIDEMKLDCTIEEFGKMITIFNPDNTRILNITVKSKDPKEAMDIANTYAKVAVSYLPETMSTNAPNIAQKAVMPDKKSGPSNTKNAIIGAVLGFIIACGFFTIRFLLDDTFHTSEDIESYYGIVPLAVVPEASTEGNGKKKKRKKLFGKKKSVR